MNNRSEWWEEDKDVDASRTGAKRRVTADIWDPLANNKSMNIILFCIFFFF